MLVRFPKKVEVLVVIHFSEYKVAEAAFPMSVLAADGILPGSKRCPEFSDEESLIMVVSEDSLLIWAERVIGDFKKHAPPKAAAKVKAGQNTNRHSA